MPVEGQLGSVDMRGCFSSIPDLTIEQEVGMKRQCRQTPTMVESRPIAKPSMRQEAGVGQSHSRWLRAGYTL